MANNRKVMDSIKSFLIKMRALDEAIPEDLAEDALQMTEEVKDALCECEDQDPNPLEMTTDSEENEDIETRVEDAMVKVMRKYGLIKDSSMSALDELEEEVKTTDEDGEEDVTVDPEKMNDSARRELIRSVKPVIAAVKDSKQRKILADSFARAIKMGTTSSQYGDIMSMARSSAQDAMFSHKKVEDQDINLGMEIAKKYNPHYKEG